MSQVGVVKILEGGVFYAKDSSGNIRELNIGDVILENEVVFGDSSNPTSAKVEMELSGNDVIVLNQAQQQLIDSSLNEVTFGNEEVTFTKNDIQNAWNNTTNDVSDDMETAAGDPTQQETQAGQEEPTEEGRVAARFSARDGNSTNVVSDLRDASWTEEQTTIIPDLEDKLIEQPLPIVFTVIDGDNVVWEGNTGTYTVKAVDAAGNPIIVNQDTIVYVRYTNIETDDNDTQYIHNTTIEVVIKAGTSEATFIVQTKDDYLADNGERFNLEITGNNSTEFDMRTGNQTGGQTNVDTTILDNSNPTTPGGEDNGFGAEDIVFAIIEGTATVNEGDTAQYVVKLVDKDGNPVTVTKDTEVTIKYTNKTTQDGDTQYKDNDTIKITIKAGENSSDKFDVDTIDDYLADNGEKFNLEITNVDDQGQFEKVNIGDINGGQTNVDTTILDNTTDKPNENSTVESDQENVILKIVAVGEDGNPIIKDGKYTFENNVAEGSNAKYMVLAFKPGTTEFKTTDVVDTQGGTVTIKTTDDTAKTTGTKDNAELDYVSETSKTVTLGEVFEIETLDDYLKDDGEKYKVSINDKTYEHPASGAIYENVVTNTDPVTTTIKDNTTPNTETNVEDVKIVLVAVSSATTTIADITNTTTGKLIIDNTNETPEGGKLYYIAVAVDKDGKPLATQGGDVTINYGTTSNTSDKDATTGVDYDNTTKVTTKVGEIFEVKTNDDYYAEGDENFTVKITDLKNSPYETPSIDTSNDTVTSTIKDNAPTINGTVVSGGEDTNSNTYGVEDTIYAIITGETTVNEGGVVTYTVKLVDKDGNTVIPTKETTVTVTYTNIGKTSTDDTNKINNQQIPVKIDASGKGTFTVETKDDYYAEADENYNVKITNVQNTGEFENVKFDSYPNTIPNSPSNNVTTTIKDNPSKVEQPDTGTGNDDPINGSYGKEDTVYVKIIGNVEVVEGGDLVHNIQLIDKDGKPVIIPDGEEITVTLTYTTNHDIKDSDFVNGSNQYNETTKTITVTIDKNTPKDENGIYKLPITNKTIDDFTSEGNEVYILTITNVAQKDGKFENIAIGNPNGGEKSVTGTIKDGVTLGDPVDTTVYEDGLNNSATTENSLSNSLGITNPNNDEYKVSFDKSITTSTEKSNGQTITYSYNESGTILTAKRTDGKVVFTVELKKDASGKDVYDFQLKEAMDHEYGNNGKNDFDLSFKFSVTSNGTTSDNKTFNVTVVDSVPNAKDKTVTTNEDTATTIRLSNDAFKDNGTIKINGSDVAKDAEISIYEPSDTNKEHPIGKLLNNGDGTVKFIPSPDYSNYDFTKSPQFSYTVTDFDGDEATATVTVNVKPVADAPTIFVKNVETKEDAENIQEGTNKVALELKVPSLSKDSDAISQISPNGYTAKQKNNVTKTNPILDGTGDYNGTSTGDSPERNGEITLEFTNGLAVTGAELYNGNIKVADITANVQVVKIVIVKTSGGTDIDTDYHHNGTLPAKGENVLYLTKAEYEGLKIQHAEDNDTDIAIKISVTSYEVDDSGKPLTGNLVTSSTTTADMTVVIKPVTDDISLKWNDESVGTISDSGKTYTFNDIDEGNTTIDLKALLSNTSGGLNGTGGTKADLDGSEKRIYTISGIPEGTVVTLGGQTAIANDKGIATIVFNDTNNKNDDPDFSMKFPENYSGTVEGKITLSVQDKGFKSNGTTNENKADWGEVKTAEVDFKVNVNPVADEATLKVGQVVGYEDTARNTNKNIQDKDGTIKHPENGIALDIKVSSTDTDGSETFTITIKDIPDGGAIFVKEPLTGKDILVTYAEDGTPTIKVWNNGVLEDYTGTTITANKGTITIEKFDNENPPKFIPPHNEHGDFKLNVDAKTVDTVIIDGQPVTNVQDVATNKDILVVVKDVADSVVGNDYNKENLSLADGTNKDYNLVTQEDTQIKLDSVFKDSTKLSSYDKESEDLTIILKSLPKGVELEGNVTLINGQYIFKASDIPSIKIVTPTNYSGELNFDITYITTEKGEANNPSKTHDSKQETDKISIFVKPTIDAQFDSQTTKAEDSEIVDGGNSYYKVDLGISHQNGDNDETLESVTIKAPEANSGYKLFIIDGNTKTEITSDYTLKTTELNKVYVEVKENQHGSFDIKGTYTVKDSQYAGKDVNYETKETKDFTHKLTITPVTDTPTIEVETGTQTHINVNVGENTEIKIPVKVSSEDIDGSENITKIVISGVPKGVTIETGSAELDAKITVSEHNGIYTITGHNLNSSNFKDIVFKVDGNANFEYRDITITAYTKDAQGSIEEQTSTKITLDKTHNGNGGGTGTGPKLDIIVDEIKKDFNATEDTQFNFLDVFKVTVADNSNDGRTELNFKIDVGSNATLKGLDAYKNADGSYTIKGNRADIESVLANLKVVPNKDFNSNQDADGISIKVETNGKESTIKAPVTPVTDSLNVEITANDSTTIDENGEFNFDIKLTNNSDKEFTNINDFYVVVNENFEAGESSKGKLYLGNTELVLVDGKYKLPADYKLGDSLNLTYKSGEDRHGAVEIKVIALNKETGAANELTSTGTTTISVKPVASSEIEVKKVQDGIEDKEMASAKLNVVKADPSEKFESVLIKVASGVAIYYNEGKSLAMNLGDGSWLVPVNSDGTLPQIFFKGNEHFGGEIKFDAIINVKDGNSKSTIELKDSSVYIKEVADGVTIDPTKTGIDAKGFEWTSLNLNANMKDVDGSEKMHFTLEGLDSSAQFRIVDKDGNITDLSSQSKFENGKWTINGIEYEDINNIQITHDKSVKDIKVEAWTQDGQDADISNKVEGKFDLNFTQDALKDGTLTLGKEMNIDFSKIESGDIKDVSTIDLGAQGENKLLNLTLQDVMDIGKKDGSGNINLTILGDEKDGVSFAKNDGWKKSETTITENNKTFDVYTNDGNSTVQVKVEQPISDGITN
ncbi:Ig-like domain-containing protein [Aliarcobacter butzleri]|uniref:Ig-like domain-containing protein n=2 Tax=Aliarcobacter butzleri TaxID=28197 RepID=A0AAW6VMM3_9BACT|nr:Ig-like domain-containing protein [Aliarcobacter butzleri]MDK2061852.1 Ig-like domain-containing protein [Aliarcobacter butzleri]MDK2070402.1 Ig-like domain-containing protein [Aliarcobacter butzleri]